MTERDATPVPDGRPIVLIVDDELAIRWSLGEAFSDSWYQVLGAGTAREARSSIKEQERPPDIAFLDLKLPDSTDLELLKTLRASAPTCEVVVITAHGTADTEREALRAGAARMVLKPFDLERIVELANTLIGSGAS